MSGATLFVLITVGVHLIGIPVMIWAVRGEQGLRGLTDWFPDEDGGDGGSRKPDEPWPRTPQGGTPLPESGTPRTRLRDHRHRVADPGRRPRRRTRTPQPAPQRAPARPRR